MNTTTNERSSLYALLIGLGCYLSNQLPNGGWYPSLGGCVRDITMVEGFLRRNLGLAKDHIVKLTATYTGPLPAPGPKHDYKPTEPPEQWPTYNNMVAAFERLTQIGVDLCTFAQHAAAQPGSRAPLAQHAEHQRARPGA